MLENIFAVLDINSKNGLIDASVQNMSVFQSQFFQMVQEKLGIDAVFFLRDADGIPKVPLVYFAALDRFDRRKIAELHRLAWNSGEAPLLFVVTPEQLLIYNNYIAPKRKERYLDEKAALIETIELINNLESERQLLKYHRLNLETGEYWRVNDFRFSVKDRVDTTLMNNLRVMRRELISNIRKRIDKESLKDQQLFSIVHSLLGRSILIKYLEERKDKDGNTVFPLGYYEKFKAKAQVYCDLLDDKNATYALFEELANRFHGDMFPLEYKEKLIINQDDLNNLKDFLLGTIELDNRQMTLWPLYSFNVIPIQLISSIYELFFHLKIDDKTRKDGTYYTPYHLVSMLMDEVLPWEGQYEEKKILDPSCGSGIFLVEAYRRLVARWMFTNHQTKISNEQLLNIMQNCIYGVDLNGEAVRIASFSLSLVMCDYLEPRSIWETLSMPRLLGYNLFANDFFNSGKFDETKYDIIIGNPPWESQLSEKAEQYIKQEALAIGDKQIAQAFSWKAGKLCREQGSVCLLMPSKGFLFNRSEKNVAYRRQFFKTFDVAVIINFSIFRKILFDHATGPATAVLYMKKKKDDMDPIFYCTPKPTFTLEDRRRFMIEPADICKIPQDIVGNQLIWKIAMWGTPRDLELINKIMTQYKSLRSFLINNKMTYAEGFIRGTKHTVNYPEYINWPIISTRKFMPFYNIKDNQETVKSTEFYRCTRENKDVFMAPHLVIKQSPKKGRFLSSFLNYDALFVNSFIGIHGEENILKYISVLLYSKVFVYYALMTSRRWLVERDELNVEEILNFPFPEVSEDKIKMACDIYDKNCNCKSIDDKQIDEFAYTIYKLKHYEIEFIENAVAYIYDYFYVKGDSIALASPNKDTLEYYQKTLCNVLKSSLGREENIETNVYRGETPLIVLQLLFRNTNEVQKTINPTTDINEMLERLDKLLLDEHSGCVSVKRNVRVYCNDRIFIVKPNQSRYWSFSAACKDADEIYADIMTTWRNYNE